MRKRPLVVCTILFVLGVLISFLSPPVRTVVATLLIFSGYLIRKGKAQLVLVALIIISLGALRMDVATHHIDEIKNSYSDEAVNATLVIAEPSDNTGVAAFLETDNGRHGVYLRVKEEMRFNCGDIVEGKMTFSKPSSGSKTADSFGNHLSSRGIYVLANADRVTVKGSYTKGIKGMLYSLRKKAHILAEKTFKGDRLALFCAMVLGDKSLLSDELYAALQGSGLNHIAVVSGMHLTVVIAFIAIVTRKILGKGRRIFLIAMVSAGFIALFTGAGVSVVRALMMCFIYYTGRILYRDQDSLTTLFCVVWIMTIINPYIIFNVGFVLSVVSMLGIILYTKNFCLVLGKIILPKVAEAVSLTIAAQLTLMPVLVYYFGVVTPYAPFSNVVAVPLSAIYVVLGMIFIVLSPIKPIATILSRVINFLGNGIIALCEGVSSLPSAMYEYTGEIIPFAAGWIFLAVIIFYRQKNMK